MGKKIHFLNDPVPFFKCVDGIKFYFRMIVNTITIICLNICNVVFVLFSYIWDFSDLQIIAFCFLFRFYTSLQLPWDQDCRAVNLEMWRKSVQTIYFKSADTFWESEAIQHWQNHQLSVIPQVQWSWRTFH